MFDFILDLLFREQCLECKKVDVPVCVDCILRAEPAVEPTNMETWSAFAFHDPIIRRSIQKLKYYRGRRFVEPLAVALYDRSIEVISEKRLLWGLGPGEVLLCIPVPLSPKRQRNRGYNQAELLTRAYASEDQMSFRVIDTVLYKTRETASQVSLKDRASRLRNMDGTFEIKNTEVIIDKCCILFDDVTTTGATLEACRRALLDAGARHVFALTVAH